MKRKRSTRPVGEEIGEIMTLKQLADYLKVHAQSIYRLVQKDLPGFRIGTDWRFRRSDIDAWIEQQASSVESQPVAKLEASRKPLRRRAKT